MTNKDVALEGAVKERPILFSDDMVNAILEGRKTQTRRVVKPPRDGIALSTMRDHGWYADRYNKTNEWCMWGRAGTPNANKQGAWLGKCPYGEPGDRLWVREAWTDTDQRFCFLPVAYRADGHVQDGAAWPWKSPLFMPRELSRILLEVTSIRVERLYAISEEDIRAEGFADHAAFRHKWESMHSRNEEPGGWDLNPLVWVVGFKFLKEWSRA
jgi:hypothetical protein